MSELRTSDTKLCEDCPPVGYPTDKTRCLPCPRRQVATPGATVTGEDSVRQTAESSRPRELLTSNTRVFRAAERMESPEITAQASIDGDQYVMLERLLVSTGETMQFALHVESARALRDWLSQALPSDETFVQPTSAPSVAGPAVSEPSNEGSGPAAVGAGPELKANEPPRCEKCQGWHHPRTNCSPSNGNPQA